MTKKILLISAFAVTAALYAQESDVIPTQEQMTGDFLVLNTQEYEGVKGLASIKPFTVSPAGEDSITVSGFYMTGCLDLKAGYNETTGMISIPAGVPIFNMETYMTYLYPWNAENEEVIMRPIEYKYAGNNTWECNTDLMLVAIQGEEMQATTFSNGSQIVRCNATSNNVSYVGAVGSQDGQIEYVESRRSYVTISGNIIDVYNILQVDQYGYGLRMSGTIDQAAGKAKFSYALTGYTNDGTYRILTGCEYNEETNMPTGVSYSGTSDYGMVYATIDLTEGKIIFDPMAIWVAEYTTDGNITVNDNLLFEFIKSVEVNYEVPLSTGIETPVVVDMQKEIERIDFYTVDGRKIKEPLDGMFVIKVTVYKDKSSQAEKMLFRRN